MVLTLVLAWFVTSLAFSLSIGPALRDRSRELSLEELVEQWSIESSKP